MGQLPARLQRVVWTIALPWSCVASVETTGGSGIATLGGSETGVSSEGGQDTGTALDGEGSSSAVDTSGDGPADEVCNGLDDDDDGMVDNGLPDLSCGAGVCAATVVACVGGVPNPCIPAAPTEEQCNGVDDDCDGVTDEDLAQACVNACGTGIEVCTSGGWTGCDAPQPQDETCNIVDDDCDGAVDDGVAACQVEITRWWHPSRGEHFYSVDPNEGFCCGYQQEASPFFRLYAASQVGTTAFYRCFQASGFHHYTTDPGCEGLPYNEGVLGYIGTSGLPGSTALYRSFNPSSGDHFFTNSAAEHASALANYGLLDEGVVGYVW